MTLRRRRGFIAAVAAALAAVAAGALILLTLSDECEHGMFNPNAVLDSSQVEDLRGEVYRVDRPDWAHAFAACRAAGFNEVECTSSVNEGEF